MDNKQQNNKKPEFNKPQIPKMKKSQKITFWIVLLLMIIVFYQLSKMSNGKITTLSYTEFMEKVNKSEVLKVVFNGKDMKVFDMNNKQYSVYLPFKDPDLVRNLSSSGILVYAQKPSKISAFLFSWLPFLIFIGFWFFMMRGMRGGAGQAFSFGKSRARLTVSGKSRITFKDVAGVDEAKEELEEIIEFLRDPKKFQRLGGRIPRGVLLLGQPGTGKTLLAKAVAGEAKVPFYSISGSDFVELFVGVGASRVRDMFAEAKKNSPCIAFIDEIDAVGRSRGTGLGGGHDEREQTLNQLLVEMDGFDPNDSVIIIAATNRPDVLDPALLRPGRFDRQVIVDLPDIKGREAILKVHTLKLPISKDVSLSLIARGTPGFSGADLANLANEAALLAARKNQKKIEMNDFEEAKDKVTLGKARKSKVITPEDKKITAFHEVGHVICSMFQEETEPIHKVSIIPRGFTGGATHFLQTEKMNYSKSYLEQTLVGLYGGRCAEEITFGKNHITTGASNDIERATDLAKKMVCNWGMSPKIGAIVVAKKEAQVFLGRDISKHEIISEETAKKIDNEIHRITSTAYNSAIEILSDKKHLLDEMAKILMEKETLNTDDIYGLAFKYVENGEKKFIEKKYKKVKEMAFDMSTKKKPNKKRTAKKKPTSQENKTDENKDSKKEKEQKESAEISPDNDVRNL